MSQAFFQYFYNALSKGWKYFHLCEVIKNDLSWWGKFLPQWNIVTWQYSHHQGDYLHPDVFHVFNTKGCFLFRYYTLQEFWKNMLTSNKFCFPSRIICLYHQELEYLSLKKVFSYRFWIGKWAKNINLEHRRTFIEAMSQLIEIFTNCYF